MQKRLKYIEFTNIYSTLMKVICSAMSRLTSYPSMKNHHFSLGKNKDTHHLLSPSTVSSSSLSQHETSCLTRTILTQHSPLQNNSTTSIQVMWPGSKLPILQCSIVKPFIYAYITSGLDSSDDILTGVFYSNLPKLEFNPKLETHATRTGNQMDCKGKLNKSRTN